jgi:hypothetical protein
VTEDKKPETIDLGDLGEVDMPEPERVDQVWTFRAACHLKDPEVLGGMLTFGAILDLGFGIYRQIDAVLDGVNVRGDLDKLFVEFAINWAANGQPNPLAVTTLRPEPLLCNDRGEPYWRVRVERIELALETLKAKGTSSLAAELVEQGLADG